MGGARESSRAEGGWHEKTGPGTAGQEPAPAAPRRSDRGGQARCARAHSGTLRSREKDPLQMYMKRLIWPKNPRHRKDTLYLSIYTGPQAGCAACYVRARWPCGGPRGPAGCRTSPTGGLHSAHLHENKPPILSPSVGFLGALPLNQGEGPAGNRPPGPLSTLTLCVHNSAPSPALSLPMCRMGTQPTLGPS